MCLTVCSCKDLLQQGYRKAKAVASLGLASPGVRIQALGMALEGVLTTLRLRSVQAAYRQLPRHAQPDLLLVGHALQQRVALVLVSVQNHIHASEYEGI